MLLSVPPTVQHVRVAPCEPIKGDIPGQLPVPARSCTCLGAGVPGHLKYSTNARVYLALCKHGTPPFQGVEGVQCAFLWLLAIMFLLSLLICIFSFALAGGR